MAKTTIKTAATKTTKTLPAKPGGLPAKPGGLPVKPGGSVAKPGAKPAVSVETTTAAAKPAGKPITAAPSERETAMATEIASLKGEIQKLTSAAAKASAGRKHRTAEEIIEGVFADDGTPLLNGIRPDDWRTPYFGNTIWIKPWRRNAKTQKFELLDTGVSYQAFLAIPRDSDGDYGSEGRHLGELAIHSAQGEDGRFRKLDYLNQDELAAVWDDDLNA